MIISDSRRCTSVSVFVNSIMSRKGLALLSYNNDGEVNIDTQSIIIRIVNKTISYAWKNKSDNRTWSLYISQPLYSYLNKTYNYTHPKFEALRMDDYIPQMLFVGVAGCGLLPPMQYLTSCNQKFVHLCKVDYGGRLPIGLTLL